jgi:hypothetical protein
MRSLVVVSEGCRPSDSPTRALARRTWEHIAADHDPVDALPADLLEHGLERRQVPVDVVDCSHAHGRIVIGFVS